MINKRTSRPGITPNTVEQNVEHGSLIYSYETPMAAYIPQSGMKNLLFYSDDCRAEGQKTVSNTTRKHLRKYKQYYLSEEMAIGVQVPHLTLLTLHHMLANPEKHPHNWVPTFIAETAILYIEN